ncbi:hypothetical protein ACWD63_28235, partial [Streptomyces clavifer]
AGRQRSRAVLSAIFFIPLLLSTTAIAMLFHGEPQPGAVGTVEEGGAGAQPGHVLTQQGSEHAQELAGFGRHGARGTIGPGRPGFVGGTGRGGGHGVISHR